MEKLYTIPEAAAELRCSVVTIRRRIKSGELKSFRNGKKYLITQAQIDEFLKSSVNSHQSDTAEPINKESAPKSISLQQAIKENQERKE